MNTQQERIQYIRQYGIGNSSNLSTIPGEKGRAEYGSVKEFRFQLLEENLDCNLSQLAAMFQLSYRQTERIVTEWKRTQRYQDYLQREWNRLYRLDTIPDIEKFRAVTTLLKQSMMQVQVDKNMSGATVNIKIVDQAPAPTQERVPTQ